MLNIVENNGLWEYTYNEKCKRGRLQQGVDEAVALVVFEWFRWW